MPTLLQHDSDLASIYDTAIDNGPSLLWRRYRAPPDVAGWLFALVAVLERLPLSISLTDVTLPGNPLIYVNPGFAETTGYAPSEVLGRNCRFLQGPQTEQSVLAELADALRRGVDAPVRFTNYRKSGEPFVNLLTVRTHRPVRCRRV